MRNQNNKNILLVLSIIAVFLMSMTLLTKAFAQSSTRSDSFSFVTSTNSYAPEDSAMPQKGVTITDPNFHTSIVRMTDKSDGYSDDGIQNEYSRSDPENCNGSFVILRANDGEVYLYDTATFQMKAHFENLMLGEEPEPRWDATDPKIFYYVYGTELCTYNIDGNISATVHDFKREFPSAAYITTKVEGDASLDRRYWSFMVEDSDYNLLSVIVYDKTLDSIVGQRSSFPDALDWTSMDMSGTHCLVGYDSHVTDVFSRDLKTSISLPQGANGHIDLAPTSDGKDVAVYQNNANDWIAMAALDTGTETKLVKIPFDVNIDIGLHFSGNCADTPGWVLVSTYGCTNPPQGSTHSWMDTQLFMVSLNANPTVWRIAHTHCYLALNYNDEKNYFAECFAAINTKGTRVYFGSNWANYTSGYSDAYMVTLPQNWLTDLSSSAQTSTPIHSETSAPTVTPEFPSTVLVAVLLVGIILLAAIIRRFPRAKRKLAGCEDINLEDKLSYEIKSNLEKEIVANEALLEASSKFQRA